MQSLSPPQSALLDVLREDVIEGSRRLLGAHLVFGELRAEIVETEAYRAEDDPASHAFRGRTNRTQVMFEEPGFAYVYFAYGCHWMLNVTAHEHGRAAAVLIRAARPLSGIETMRERRSRGARRLRDEDLLSGPGKLAQAFGIDQRHNGSFLFDPSAEFRIEAQVGSRSYFETPRIGIAIGKGENYPWRFVDRENAAWASGPKLRA